MITITNPDGTTTIERDTRVCIRFDAFAGGNGFPYGPQEWPGHAWGQEHGVDVDTQVSNYATLAEIAETIANEESC